MVERDRPTLSLVRQCALLGVGRSSIYYRPAPVSEEDLELMALIDRQYLKTPFYGSRRMVAWLRRQGYPVNRKRLRRLMRLMGLEAIYQKPNTSRPDPGNRVYPYLARAAWPSSGRAKSGPPTSPIFRWPGVSSTWW